MKVLHVVKTPVGATWAFNQVAVLRSLGVEITVLIPPGDSSTVQGYEACGCEVIRLDADLGPRQLLSVTAMAKRLREVVKEVRPDVIHSHFVGTTIALRLALGRDDPIPRVFQVPGPLHLEHRLFRMIEMLSAGKNDVWVGSSRYTVNCYRRQNIPEDRLYLSYYGFDARRAEERDRGQIAETWEIADNALVVGNVNWMYPPKYFLGQTVGIKCHEDVIDALGMAIRRNKKIIGVLVGGAWGGAQWYERRLQRRASEVAGNRIRFLGPMSPDKALRVLNSFNLAVHVPISENCGGVVEPLLCGVPVIASAVGGLPEVVVDGKTGRLLRARDPRLLADSIIDVLADEKRAREMAAMGRHLVSRMFDIQRTAREIYEIYLHLLNPCHPAPATFNPTGII